MARLRLISKFLYSFVGQAQLGEYTNTEPDLEFTWHCQAREGCAVVQAGQKNAHRLQTETLL